MKEVPTFCADKMKPIEVCLETFVSISTVTNLEKKMRDVAKGHLILLHTEDAGLLISLLLEGSTLDFCLNNDSKNGMKFGNSREAMVAKNYIRGLEKVKQLKVVEFYKSMYTSVVNFYNQVETLGIFCECFVIFCLKSTVEKEVIAAYDVLHRVLYDADNITQPELM
jgi:hypothetical protein